MKRTTKIWLGVGAFVVAGAGPATSADVAPLQEASLLEGSALADPRADAGAFPADIVLAQHRAHGGEGSSAKKGTRSKQGGEGEGGENEGGAKAGEAKLPPDLDFALRIAQMRGHLLIGDELVKQNQWNAAYPHFRHPTEELYGGIRNRLKEYKVPPFEAALKALANAVKARKSGDDYANAWKTVSDALDAADAGLKIKQPGWDGFVVETAVETLKSATGEYQQAIVKGRIAKPVEYQDARGFIWQAERMIETVAPGLEKKDGDALAHLRTAIAELKKAFPAAMPPNAPVKDYGAVLGDVSRIELAAGKLM
jgi:hypothetical protein